MSGKIIAVAAAAILFGSTALASAQTRAFPRNYWGQGYYYGGPAVMFGAVPGYYGYGPGYYAYAPGYYHGWNDNGWNDNGWNNNW
jgi:hypothetical protein